MGLVRLCQRINLHDCVIPFFIIASAPIEIYTLSLHDALPISLDLRCKARCAEIQLAVQPRRRLVGDQLQGEGRHRGDRKSTRLNSSHEWISYAVFCLKKKKD